MLIQHPSQTWLASLCQFIQSNLQEDLTLADLAQAVDLTPRALQYAFKRELQTTPMRWLRQERLKLVNQTLKTKTPGITVTQAAIASGFTNLGIFARYYHEQYGEKPSRTLRVKVN